MSLMMKNKSKPGEALNNYLNIKKCSFINHKVK